MSRLDAQSYLEHARPIPGSNQFAVGTYERNITLYRQQMRALNLVFSLSVGGGFPLGTRVAIIGGGAFGLTAAAAAAWIGYDVRLYERRQVLLPLQKGCDTRWINPRYYEWPAAGSETRYAGLPLMNWQAGTASQVADQLENEFVAISAKTHKIRHFIGVKGFRLQPSKGEATDGQFDIKCRYSGNMQELWRCSIVVFATGFGIEENLGSSTVPYWHNDNYGQVDLRVIEGNRKQYFVSGTGDGGLTDVARLKIVNFRHERIFFELFDNVNEDFAKGLRQVQQDWLAQDNPPADWLYEQFDRIAGNNVKTGLMAEPVRRLESRVRTDTRVVLNGTADRFSECLSLRETSLSNALLAFLLHAIGAFQYRGGRLKRVGDAWRVVTGSRSFQPRAEAEIVVRHGTKRAEALRDAGFAEAENALVARRDAGVDSAARIFPPGWWHQNRSDQKSPPGIERPRVEFVPPATALIAKTFVSTLGDLLTERLLQGSINQDGRPSPPLFRVTLHRLACLDEGEWFQQIAPYSGSLLPQQVGGLGRIFPVQAGLVGLAIRLGRPVIFRREPGVDFNEMLRETNFSELAAHPIEGHVDSIIACPFFVASSDNAPARRVAFTIFADTSERAFFDTSVLRLVYAACKGFVENIEGSLASGQLRQISSDYAGHLPTMSASQEDLDRLRKVGITLDDQEFAKFGDDLTFATLASTELDVSA